MTDQPLPPILKTCSHCKGLISIRMPVPESGCDHLYYPESCAVCRGDQPLPPVNPCPHCEFEVLRAAVRMKELKAKIQEQEVFIKQLIEGIYATKIIQEQAKKIEWLKTLVPKSDEWPKDFDVYALFKKSEDQAETIKIYEEELESFVQEQKDVLEMIRTNKFVFAGKGGRWEKMAFSLYTEICDIAQDAQRALDRVRGKA